MKNHSSIIFSLMLLFGAGGCGEMVASSDLDQMEQLGGGKADGYYFTRGLSLGERVQVGGPIIDGVFDEALYAAVSFEGKKGRVVDVTSYTDFYWSSLLGPSPYKIDQMLFVWAPRRDSTDRNDPDNWSLLRFDDNNSLGADHSWKGDRSECTELLLPEDGEYMVVLLTNPRSYADRAPFHIEISYADDVDTTPGSLSGSIAYGSGAPAEGIEVSVGTESVSTDASGRFSFPSLLPNRYTIKLGSEGYVRFQTQVRPGRETFERIYIDHPIP